MNNSILICCSYFDFNTTCVSQSAAGTYCYERFFELAVIQGRGIRRK